MKVLTMKEELLFAINWYLAFRNSRTIQNELEQRFLEADVVIELLARELVLLIRERRGQHVA